VIKKKSPAKINLYLRVNRRRTDGYHDITSLMQLITLYDELRFSPQKTGIVLSCSRDDLPVDEKNLVYRAAAAFYARTGITPGIRIGIHKRIPLGAGLGGGSSNAATTLMTLNEIHKTALTKNDLMRLGETLGADVPFFVFGKTAWVSGRGEKLQEAPPLPRMSFVLINPGFPVSTHEVYEGLNWGLTKKRRNYSIPRFSSIQEVAAGLANDLEGVVSTLYPVVNEIKAFLLKNGALGALMTGSGPTVFGIFKNNQASARVKRTAVLEKGWLVFDARPV